MSYVVDKGRELAVGGIKGLLKKLWDESKPGLDRSGVNRFRYDAGNVRLFGRNDELAFLWEFCHADVHFSWFAISGEGGSGKTRLAYTLGKLLKYAPGWSYRKVDYARPDGLAEAKQALKDAPQNTLLVLDYVKWHTDSIGQWLYDLWSDWHERNLKIRVLLVERDAITPRDLCWQHDVMAAQYRPATDAPFLDDNSLMRLWPLDDDDMISVVNDYATAFDAQVDAPLIIETLKKIDTQLKRPLYALFLTDAYLMGNDLRTWDREDALEYVYLKERERILFNADGLPAKLQAIVFHALLVATLSGGMEYNKFAELMPNEVAMLEDHATKDYSAAPELFSACLGISYDEGKSLRILPLEPDLLGEFFCIQELWSLKDRKKQETLGLAMLNDLPRTAVVFDRIARDYGDLLREMKMYKVFTAIAIPDSIRKLSKRTFQGYESLIDISCTTVKIISKHAFRGCSGLTSMSLPLAETIDKGAFCYCNRLMNISFPLAVRIGHSAFAYCTNLSEVFLPVAKSISKFSFYHCTSLTKIHLPSVQTIGLAAFWECDNLTEAYFPDSINSIDKNAFGFCEKLKNVYVYGKVTDAIRNAFEDMDVTFHELPKDASSKQTNNP